MRQSLQLKIGHQLTMTPQLQQAIRLLQLSSLDLHQEIQQALYSNPLLELSEEYESTEHNDSAEEQRDASDVAGAPQTDAAIATGAEWENAAIPEELPVDARWEDIYPSSPAAQPTVTVATSRAFTVSLNRFATISTGSSISPPCRLSTTL